jgi:hypothetical protein
MPRIEVTYVEFSEPFFMMGTNFGNKIVPSQKGAKAYYDEDKQLFFFVYKGDLQIMNREYVKCWKVSDPSIYDFDLNPANVEKAGPVFRPQKTETAQDNLIAQARALAAGGKPQVAEPTKPAKGLTGLEGSPKYMTHDQLKAKVEAEKQKPGKI